MKQNQIDIELTKLADELGQCIFRVETSFTTFQHTTNDATMEQCRKAILMDLENLKEVKQKLINMAI